MGPRLSMRRHLLECAKSPAFETGFAVISNLTDGVGGRSNYVSLSAFHLGSNSKHRFTLTICGKRRRPSTAQFSAALARSGPCPLHAELWMARSYEPSQVGRQTPDALDFAFAPIDYAQLHVVVGVRSKRAPARRLKASWTRRMSHGCRVEEPGNPSLEPLLRPVCPVRRSL